MFDKELASEILAQISGAIEIILFRFQPIQSVEDLLSTPKGKEKLDGICMQLITIGESLKNLDKITKGELLKKYQEIDWRGAMGMRDIICHHYFDIDAEAIYLVCSDKLKPLAEVIKKIKEEL